MSIYQKALNNFGFRDQISMTQGECGELIAALTKYYTQNRGNIEDVAEEIADVEIMLSQMRILAGPALVDKIKAEKLERLELIINGDIDHQHKGK